MSATPNTVSGDFTFMGVYADKTFTDQEVSEGVYGYLAKPYGTNSAGQFVKGVSGTKIKGMRGYLKFTGSGSVTEPTGDNTASARSNDLDNPLPNTLNVVLIDNDGNTTSLGEMQLTKQLDDDTAVYNLNGQRIVMGQKGLIIKNGKKIMVK